MEDYKRGSHTVWDCKYHLVWSTKCRYQVLEGEVGQRCRELLREIARSLAMLIYAGSINRDPVHMAIGIANQRRAAFPHDEVVVFVGKAQEKCTVYRTEKRHNP